MRYETHWEFLKNSALLGKLSHAYLFSGNDEEGQQRLALQFSQLLNCESGAEKKPCGACSSCKGMRERTHPDAVWVSEAREIPISAIRNLRQHFSLSSWQSSFKIAVIERAHLMNMEAQSALLKLLEEPRKNVLLLLLCEYPALLLDTIRSRTQEMRWYAFSETAQESLKGTGELRRLGSSLLQERFDYAKKAAETSEDAAQILEGWLRVKRDVLLKAVQSAKDVARNMHMVQTMQEMLQVVKTTNVTPRLALEQVLLEL